MIEQYEQIKIVDRLPKLRKEETNRLISVFLDGELLKPTELPKNFIWGTGSPVIEVGGTPNIYKSTMCTEAVDNLNSAGVNALLFSEPSPQFPKGSDPYEYTLYNLAMAHIAVGELMADFWNPNSIDKTKIFDRGVLGQIPFMYAFEEASGAPLEHRSELAADYIIEFYRPYIDVMIICRASAETSIKIGGESKAMPKEVISHLNKTYDKLPEIITRKALKSMIKGGYSSSDPLIFVTLDMEKEGDAYYDLFYRSICSIHEWALKGRIE